MGKAETRGALRETVLVPDYDKDLAGLIRRILKDAKLDIPGTAYFDESLDCLSAYYDREGRTYLVLLEGDKVIGGAGLAECGLFEDCCELQKLYLDPAFRGRGLGYGLVLGIEERARQLGYQRIYLETHTCLEAAMALYERMGYREIEKPAALIHSAMDRFYLKDLREDPGRRQ